MRANLFPDRGCFRARRYAALLLGLTFAFPGAAVFAQPATDATTPPSSPPRVTTIQQYWDLSAEEKAQPVVFSLDCDITYADPAWAMLFIQDRNGTGAYVPYGANPFAFRAGQHILAEGTFVPPNADVSFEHATIKLQGTARLFPRSIVGKVMQYRQYVTKFIALEGLVDRYRRLDPTHLQLYLSVEGEPVVAWVLTEPDDDVPDLRNSFVSVEGVYNPKIGLDGLLASLEIMVPGLAHLTQLNRLDDDARFKAPLLSIESLRNLPEDQLVHIRGEVKGQEPGRYVRVRDESGQIDVLTGQTTLCPINTVVDAIGYPNISAAEWQLRSGVFREVTGPAAAPGAPARTGPAGARTLRLAQQVRELSVPEAERGLPVWLTGVVTWSSPDSPFFFVQDSSGGLCIMRGESTSAVRPIGRTVEVRGITAMGPFAPVVIASRFDKISEQAPPLARQITLDYALTGAEEATWVEMRGFLRRIERRGAWNDLEMVTPAGDFTAVLPAAEDVSALVGAVIRLHGVCAANANTQRRLTGITLYVPGAAFAQIEEEAPQNPFDLPTRSLGSLGQFDTLLSSNRRLKVSGVVLHNSPGHLIHIADAGQALLVLSRSQVPLEAGDRIEVVGFPGWQGGRLVLREAVYRKTGRDQQPMPITVRPQQAPAPDLDGQLVKVTGTLIDTAAVGGQFRLSVQAGNLIFEGLLENLGRRPDLPSVPVGAVLSLLGVYELKYDEFGQPDAFQLRLRTPADITVLVRPSWFTRDRILVIASLLGVGILLFVAWVTALRRRVRAQTEQIRRQLQREARLEAELQRASRLESIGHLAGGIAHDFNNLLTVVMGNLSLVRLDRKMETESVEALADAEKAAVRARDLTQQLLTFAKGGAPIRSAVLLPDVVREVAEFALRGSPSRCRFDVAEDLWPADVDKGQIGQVVQNIVINASQAVPQGTSIDVSLRNEEVGAEMAQVLTPGRYIKLTIADHGPGIPADDLPKIFDPYFTTKKQGSGLGLTTVHSIVKKHRGHISVESALGQGATFRIWLPAAANAPEAAARRGATAPPFAAGPARILFMDDEEQIRKVGQAILGRLGYEVTTVNDGAAAVQEYTRAREQGRPFGLVILDLTVPGGVGGRQAMEQLLKIDPAVRAIVSSGYSNDQVLSDHRAHGFKGMVLKPYEIGDVAKVVQRVLRGESA